MWGSHPISIKIHQDKLNVYVLNKILIIHFSLFGTEIFRTKKFICIPQSQYCSNFY